MARLCSLYAWSQLQTPNALIMLEEYNFPTLIPSGVLVLSPGKRMQIHIRIQPREYMGILFSVPKKFLSCFLDTQRLTPCRLRGLPALGSDGPYGVV